MRIKIIPVMMIIACCAFSAQAKLYKWVDEKGQTHFGDKIPSKYLVKKHVELSETGDVIKTFAAAETPEQKARRKQLEIAQRKAELIEKKKKQRDRVLLDTYTTERDLVLARDSRLEAVDSQIHLAESIVEDSSRKVESLSKTIADIKSSGRVVPDDMFNRLENEKSQVKVQSAAVHKHKKRRQEINDQFNGYIERFRVLKAEQKARRDKLLTERGL